MTNNTTSTKPIKIDDLTERRRRAEIKEAWTGYAAAIASVELYVLRLQALGENVTSPLLSKQNRIRKGKK